MKNLRNMLLCFFLLSSPALFAMQATKNTTTPNTPENFSWVVDGQLCGLARPSDNNDLKFLEKNNVGLLVTLTKERDLRDSLFRGTKLERLFLPIEDYDIPTFKQVDQFIAASDKVLESKKAVAVHCAAGNGRTGIMLACWLVAKEKIAPDVAVKTIQSKRPGAIKLLTQQQFVMKYAQYLKTGTKSDGKTTEGKTPTHQKKTKTDKELTKVLASLDDLSSLDPELLRYLLTI